MGETIMIQQMKRGRIQLQYIKGKGQVTKQLVQWHNFFFYITYFLLKKTIFLNTETIMESTHSKKKKTLTDYTTRSTTGVIIGFFNDVTC